MISIKLSQFLHPIDCVKSLCQVRNFDYRRYPTPYLHPNPLNQPIPTNRAWKAKHRHPKYKDERKKKMIKIDLPDFQKEKDNIKRQYEMTPEEGNKKLKEMGMQPIRPWNERPIFLPSTAITLDRYVPPEGDGKANFLSKKGSVQSFEFLKNKGKSYSHLRKIRNFEDTLELDEFCGVAKDIYIALHNALSTVDEKKLHTLATETVYPLLVNETKLRTINWAFYGSLEPEKVVLVRHTTGINDDDYFAQLTVRFHTQQTLAVYDRFGRLIHGSENVLRDVLEYIVFEKHISSTRGMWRVHDKIQAPWQQESKNNSLLTYKVD